MRVKWIAALIAVLALGVIAAGCGDDDSTSSSTTEVTSSDTSTAEDSTSTEDSTSADTGSSTPDDVYNACLDVIEGTPAESAGQAACAQARDAFENCATQAESAPEGDARDLAIQACQQAADQATQQLQAAG